LDFIESAIDPLPAILIKALGMLAAEARLSAWKQRLVPAPIRFPASPCLPILARHTVLMGQS